MWLERNKERSLGKASGRETEKEETGPRKVKKNNQHTGKNANYTYSASVGVTRMNILAIL